MATDKRQSLVARRVAGLLALIILAGLCQPLSAQIGTANLSGTVIDSTGAVIPDAQVVLKSMTENASRQTTTDAVGRYQIPAILPGTYSLVVDARGFEAQRLENISLSSGQGSTLNVTLQPGVQVTQVNVTGEVPLLETTTASVGTTIPSEMATSLPLLGRNFTSLITILPGVAAVNPPDSHNYAPTGNYVNPSVFGQRQRSNVYTLDGLPDAELIFNAVPMFPPPEAISEMKVQSGSDIGAMGFASGASINLVSNSGTNAYHGDAWEFLQNNAMNAKNYFAKTVGKLHYNQFGGDFGGPLQIPYLLSRSRNWYVFGYYEGIRTPSHSTYYGLYPTAAELSGDFSADITPTMQIYDPYSSTVSPNGTLLSRQAFPGGIIPSKDLNTTALTVAKAFYPLPNLAPAVVPGKNFSGTAVTTNSPNQYSVRIDHQFGSADNFFGRFSQSLQPQTSVNLAPAPQFPNTSKINTENLELSDTHTFNPTTFVTVRGGWQRVNYTVLNSGPDVAKQAGLLNTFPAWHGRDLIVPIGIPGYPTIAESSTLYGPENLTTVTADVQKIIGKHTLGFGGDFWLMNFLVDNLSNTGESFSSVPTASSTGKGGLALASYLLGLPSSANRLVGSSEASDHGRAFGLYLQDNFRATNALDINYGIRWEFATPFVNDAGTGAFLFETGQYYWDKTNPATGVPANLRRGAIDPEYHCLAPRFGIAYQLPENTVVRASYGIFFDTFGNGYAQTQQGSRGNWPFAYPQTLTGLNIVQPAAFIQNPFPGPAVQPTPTAFGQNLNVYPKSSRVPYVSQWSMSLQHAFGSHVTAEVDYFGSLGVKLSGQIVDNVATTPGTDSYKNRQPYPTLAPYVLNGYNEFNSWYEGVAAKVTVRVAHNLNLLANYTHAKTMDMVDSFLSTGAINPTRYTMDLNRAPAGFNIPNIFNFSYVYDLPSVTQNRFFNAIIGGWSTSGIFSAHTGTPYYVTLQSDNENIGFAGRRTEFPNFVGNPTTGFTQSKNEWFNTAAFALPAFGTRGNGNRHALYAQSVTSWNASLYKRWFFQEQKYVELRGEAFNLPNSHHFNAPGTGFGTSSFGKISSTSDGGRSLQVGLKLHF